LDVPEALKVTGITANNVLSGFQLELISPPSFEGITHLIES